MRPLYVLECRTSESAHPSVGTLLFYLFFVRVFDLLPARALAFCISSHDAPPRGAVARGAVADPIARSDLEDVRCAPPPFSAHILAEAHPAQALAP